jgi:hypothetical protein
MVLNVTLKPFTKAAAVCPTSLMREAIRSSV